MLIDKLTILFSIGTISTILMCGCETIYGGGGYGGSRSARQEAVLRQQMEQQQLRQDAQSARAAAQSLESQVGQMDLRLERIEATTRSGAWATQADLEILRAENKALRDELALAKSEHERLRSEIVGNVQNLIKEMQKRSASSQTSSQARTSSLSGYEHKVESGQTLSEIAKAYGVSMKKIIEANKLKGDVIRVGQILFIPD